jgi:outer membrane lipase/esterase
VRRLFRSIYRARRFQAVRTIHCLRVDDHINSNLLLGLAFNYSTPQGSLNQGFGTVKINAEQLSLYGSWSSSGYFIDFTGIAGHNSYTITRPGVLNSIGGKTNGPDVVVAANVGNLLLGTGTIRVGPIFGLNYAMVHENGYTETGDWLLSQVVGAQTLNSFIGSAGVQLRLSGTVRDTMVNSYMNLTADHEFLNPARDIMTSQLSTPEIVVATPVAGTGTQTYGQIVAGLSVKVARNLAVNGSLGTQFGGSAGAASFGVEGGLSYRF